MKILAISDVHGKKSESLINYLKQNDDIKNLIENNGYDKGFQDAIEKAKRLIISFMPLPSNKNHNINCDLELLKEREKYAKQVAKKFEEMMNSDKRSVI